MKNGPQSGPIFTLSEAKDLLFNSHADTKKGSRGCLFSVSIWVNFGC